jgi:putative transposase
MQEIRTYVRTDRCAGLLGISVSTLRSWMLQVKATCSGSLINRCRKVHPGQLLFSETEKIRKLLTDKRFRCWPLGALYFYSLRNNIVSMAESTWYRYVKLLNIDRLKPRSVKIYGQGLRAAFPNQYWHADVTLVKTADGVRNYIYTVIDNFSRFPLVVKVSTKLCGKLRAETFREALRLAVQQRPTLQTIHLMVDGGSENYNSTVEEFLASPDPVEIKRIRALNDVAFSNSMAEAFNKTLKNYYLNHHDIKDFSMLEKLTEEMRLDFSHQRPHAVLKGLTPYEAYTGKHPNDVSWADQLRSARKERIVMNQRHHCPSCFIRS